MMMMMMLIIQFNSLLFMCRINRYIIITVVVKWIWITRCFTPYNWWVITWWTLPNCDWNSPYLQILSILTQFIMLNFRILFRCVHQFGFRFFAVYMQPRLTFSRRFLFDVTTCFGLTGHHLMYRLWWRNLLLTVKLFCFCYVVAWY
jgi:hypothetical protein